MTSEVRSEVRWGSALIGRLLASRLPARVHAPRTQKTRQNKRLGRDPDPSEPDRLKGVHSANNAGQRQITSLRCGRISGSEDRGGRWVGGKKTRPSTQYTVNDLASPGY